MTKIKTSADNCPYINLLREGKQFKITGNSSSSNMQYFKVIIKIENSLSSVSLRPLFHAKHCSL